MRLKFTKFSRTTMKLGAALVLCMLLNNTTLQAQISQAKEIVFSEVKLIKYLKDGDWVKLYPNPTEGIIYFEFDGKEGEEVQVWVSNIIGQSIQKRMVIYTEDGRNYVKMDLSGFAQGAYLFNYQNSNGKSQVIKFLKTN